MKKTIAILLVFCLCVGMCACGKSAEAQKADELILAIGGVSLEKESAILAAKAYYDTLTDEQKAQVKNAAVLDAAVNELTRIKDKIIEYKKIYEEAKDFETQNLLDEAYAKYKALPADYEDAADRIKLLEPYVGLVGEWHCDSETAIATDGSVFEPCFVMGWIEISSIDSDSVELEYSLGFKGETKSIFRGAPDLKFSIASGDIEGSAESQEDGTLILGTAHGFTVDYGSMDITFKYRTDNKLEIEYKRTIHKYNAGVETYIVNSVVFTYSKAA